MASKAASKASGPAPGVTEKRKPVFTKVDRLQPGTNGHTLTVKVVSSNDVTVTSKVNRSSTAVLSRPPARNSRIAECLVGDETGSIIFTARNEQVAKYENVSVELASLPRQLAALSKCGELTWLQGINPCIRAAFPMARQLAALSKCPNGYMLDIMKPGTTIILRNAKIDMFKGTMRLAVDKWGRVEETEPANFVANEKNNLSLVEYELVNVPTEE